MLLLPKSTIPHREAALKKVRKIVVIKSNMRREAAATDPLAQITAPHQAAQSVTASQPPTEQGMPLPQRAAQSTTLTPDESAEFMTNAFASRCR